MPASVQREPGSNLSIIPEIRNSGNSNNQKLHFMQTVSICGCLLKAIDPIWVPPMAAPKLDRLETDRNEHYSTMFMNGERIRSRTAMAGHAQHTCPAVWGPQLSLPDGSHPIIYAENDPPARLQPIRMPSFGNIHIAVLLDRYLQRLCASHLQALSGLVMQ